VTSTLTYFGFHLRVLLPPILVLGVLVLRDSRRGKRLPAVLRRRPAGLALLIHVALAVIYTTPWDNYLVATRVWWYDPARVTGVTLGWVPIAEYTFFVLQTVLTGLWLVWLGRRLADRAERSGLPALTRR
jgi:lycopene cyclase domain-containing protein